MEDKCVDVGVDMQMWTFFCGWCLCVDVCEGLQVDTGVGLDASWHRTNARKHVRQVGMCAEICGNASRRWQGLRSVQGCVYLGMRRHVCVPTCSPRLPRTGSHVCRRACRHVRRRVWTSVSIVRHAYACTCSRHARTRSALVGARELMYIRGCVSQSIYLHMGVRARALCACVHEHAYTTCRRSARRPRQSVKYSKYTCKRELASATER